MSRQLDLKREERTAKRSAAVVRALEFGLVGALQTQGMELRGLSIIYEEFSCLLTLRVEINGARRVCHVAAGNIIDCFLRADSDAINRRLRFKKDKYHPNGV